MAQCIGSKNIPASKAAVFIGGIMILLGGLSILLGFWLNIVACLLIVFLVLIALMMHDFWNVEDPMDRQNEMKHFLKDLSLQAQQF